MFKIKGKYTEATIMIDQIEDSALRQIYNLLNHPAFTEKIAIMADVHMSSGVVVGFTMPLTEKIVPNVCGVDISCGVLCVNIGDKIDIKLDRLNTLIRRNIPMGPHIHKDSILDFKKEYKWKEANEMANKFIVRYNEKFGTNYKSVEFDYEYFLNLIKRVGSNENSLKSIGTLGGGNHYLELGKSSNTNNYYVSIHSGSRNLGKRVCEYHQEIAKKALENKRTFELKSRIDHTIQITKDVSKLPKLLDQIRMDLGLNLKEVNINGMEYLEGQDSINYFMDLIFINFYADLNRWTMMNIILDILKVKEMKDYIHSVHNYIDFKDMIIRKGAISAHTGENIIIPLNMRDGSLICVGKSDETFNYSSPHGAGRIMARGEANRKVDLDKFRLTMKGIYSTSVGKGTLDESPFAYKKPEMIENAIGDIVEIVDRIKPILNIKSTDSEDFRENKKKDKQKTRQIGEDKDDLINNKDFRSDRKKLRAIRGKF